MVGDVALGVRQIHLMFVKSQVKLKDNHNYLKIILITQKYAVIMKGISGHIALSLILDNFRCISIFLHPQIRWVRKHLWRSFALVRMHTEIGARYP